MMFATLPVDAAGCIVDGSSGYGVVAVGPDVGSLQSAAGSAADAIHIRTEMQGGQLLVARQYESPCASDSTRPRSGVVEAAKALSKPEQLWDVRGTAAATALLKAIPTNNARQIFIGDDDAIKAIKTARPKARAFTVASARQCTSDYRGSGITGAMPPSCANGVMLLTLDDLGMMLWGWPNRLMARANTAGVTLIIAQSVDGETIKGLTDVTQYGAIAHSYNGYIWIDDIADLGPSLRR